MSEQEKRWVTLPLPTTQAHKQPQLHTGQANSSKASSLNHTGWATYGLPESHITRKQLQKESGLAPADMAAVPLHDEMGKLYLQHDQECALGAANLLQMVGHLPTYQGRVGVCSSYFQTQQYRTGAHTWCTLIYQQHLRIASQCHKQHQAGGKNPAGAGCSDTSVLSVPHIGCLLTNLPGTSRLKQYSCYSHIIPDHPNSYECHRQTPSLKRL